MHGSLAIVESGGARLVSDRQGEVSCNATVFKRDVNIFCLGKWIIL